jgi:hypothetical protein
MPRPAIWHGVRSRERVFVVEDEPQVVETLSELLDE